MKLTNNFNLPASFENFDSAHSYSMGDSDTDASITGLIDSPQILRLRKKFAANVEEDVSDRIMSILGTAVHQILRDGAPENSIPEERFYAEINGWKISGQVDLITPTDAGLIVSDYKTVRGATLLYNAEGKIEWERQLNAYAELIRFNPDRVHSLFRSPFLLASLDSDVGVVGLEVIAIVRDWTAAQAERNERFPQAPVVRIPIPMWSSEDCIHYLSERVSLHRAGSAECTDEEMWSKGATFAVYQYTQGGTVRKRATRVLDSHTDAETFGLELGTPYKVEKRPAVYSRCVGNYCNVADFCDQYHRRQKNGS